MNLIDVSLMTWAVSGVCVVLVGIAKAGFAGGIGVIAVPLLCLVMAPSKAAAMLLPLLGGCDLVSIYFYRKTFSLRGLRDLDPGAALGISLGALFLWLWSGNKEATERGLKVMIGVISLFFVVYQVGKTWIFKNLERYHPKPWHGPLFGSAAGFASTLAHAGGPPVTMFLLPQHMDRRIFVGTTVWLFTLINATKLIPYYWLGLFSTENVSMSLYLMPLVPIGVVAGVWMNERIDQEIFIKIVYAILFLTGLQLLTGWNPVEAVWGWLGVAT